MGLSYWQHQYGPRVTVADSQRYFDGWRDRAAQARQSLAGQLDIAYGSGKRERLDLFRRPEGAASGTLVFIHGGYWRAFGKEDFSWVADPFVARGISVAVLSYPLMPEADLPTIRRAISRAFECLTTDLLTARERARLVVVGHSAGAYLATQYVTSSGQPSFQFTPKAIVGVSGLYDLLPVYCAGHLADGVSNPGELYDASPLYAHPPGGGAVLVAVGADESREFQRQSERLVDAWEPRVCGFLRIPRRNHFSVIGDLADESSELFLKVLAFFRYSP
jgi:arylformamidase